MSGPGVKGDHDPEIVSQQPNAEPHTWQIKQYEAYIRTVNALTTQLAANQQKQDANDRDKSFLEKFTISLVALTLIATGFGDWVFFMTMRDARIATFVAHKDETKALTEATNASNAQQADTIAALKIAQGQLDVTRDSEVKQLRPYPSMIFGPLKTLSQGVNPTISIIVTSEGQTPTQRVGILWDTKILEYPYRGKIAGLLSLSVKKLAYTNLAIRTGTNTGGDFGRALSRIDMLTLSQGRARLYAYAELVFDDGFNRKPHHIWICQDWYISPNGSTSSEVCDAGVADD